MYATNPNRSFKTPLNKIFCDVFSRKRLSHRRWVLPGPCNYYITEHGRKLNLFFRKLNPGNLTKCSSLQSPGFFVGFDQGGCSDFSPINLGRFR